MKAVLNSDGFGCSLPQEFDNYAEWDLRDIDFVEDDSDILHGNIYFIRGLLNTIIDDTVPDAGI